MGLFCGFVWKYEYPKCCRLGIHLAGVQKNGPGMLSCPINEFAPFILWKNPIDPIVRLLWDYVEESLKSLKPQWIMSHTVHGMTWMTSQGCSSAWRDPWRVLGAKGAKHGRNLGQPQDPSKSHGNTMEKKQHGKSISKMSWFEFKSFF